MKKVFRAIPLIFVLIASLAACGTGAATPEPTSPTLPAAALPTVQNEPVPTVMPSDLCNNEYFPVKNDQSWVYSSTGSPVGPYEFEQRMRATRPEAFTIRSLLKKTFSTQHWDCTAQGLVPTSMIINNATSMLAFQKFDTTTLKNINGVFLPSSIQPGMQWTYSFDIEGAQTGENVVISTMQGNIAQDFVAGNRENVVVPAGSFDAIAIQVNTRIKLTITTDAGNSLINLNSTYTYWFAPGVGMVKMAGNGRIGGQDFFETIELISFK